MSVARPPHTHTHIPCSVESADETSGRNDWPAQLFIEIERHWPRACVRVYNCETICISSFVINIVIYPHNKCCDRCSRCVLALSSSIIRNKMCVRSSAQRAHSRAPHAFTGPYIERDNGNWTGLSLQPLSSGGLYKASCKRQIWSYKYVPTFDYTPMPYTSSVDLLSTQIICTSNADKCAATSAVWCAAATECLQSAACALV